MEEKLLTIGEAAKLMEVCENTLRDWDIEGKFKAQKFGGHRHYSLDQIRDYLKLKSERKFSVEIKDNRQEWLSEWSEYLGDIPTKEQLTLAVLLKNCKMYCESTDNVFSTNQALWLTKRSWQFSRFKNLISVQPMTGPASLVFFAEHMGGPIRINSEAIGAESSTYDFKFFGSANFDDVKLAYAIAIAKGIDQFILNRLQKTNRVDCESLLDLNSQYKFSFKEKLMDYFVGPQSIVDLFKDNFEGVDLFGIDNVDTETYKPISITGRYPNCIFTGPIFCPYLLFFAAPTTISGNSSAIMRAGWRDQK